MNKLFMKAEEIQEELGISKTYAYKIIKELNEELEKMGITTSISDSELFDYESGIDKTLFISWEWSKWRD